MPGGCRAGGGRSRQLRPHWCPPTHPRLLSPCWGGNNPNQTLTKPCVAMQAFAMFPHMAVSILYPSTQSLLNGPPRHLLPWARIPRVCWLGPEPQGTPNHTFLSPNGSPWHHLGPGDRARGQNFAANLARGVPPPQSQLFFHHFGAKKCPNVNFCEFFENGLPQPGRIWAPRGPLGPKVAWGPYFDQ